jgi:hypothetical protein
MSKKKPISGRIIKTANSDNVVLMSGNTEIMVNNMEVYREALKDIKIFIEFEVDLEIIEEETIIPHYSNMPRKYFHYQIIVPDDLFQNYEQEEDTHSGGESGEEKR